MNRLLLMGGSLVAAAAVAALPAVVGLSGNPSFSHQLPVRVPSQAQVVQFVERHHGGPSAERTTGVEDRPTMTGAASTEDRRSRGGRAHATSAAHEQGSSGEDGRHGGDGPGHA